MFTSCVEREVSPGNKQFVPVSEVASLKASDIIHTGEFRVVEKNNGHTICVPSGATKTSVPCVLREVCPGDIQFVPTNEVPVVYIDERVFAGSWEQVVERHGPSGSHVRTICLPACGQPIESRIAA